MTLCALGKLWTDTFTEWNEDKPFQLAAALSYYTLFSLAPLLIIALAVAGLVFGREASQQQLLTTLQGLVGPQGAQAIQALIHHTSKPRSGLLATLVGLVTLLLGAGGGVVGQLQDSLNTIWGVAPKPGLGFMGLVRKRFFSFGLVLGIGFLLLVSLVVSAALTAFLHFIAGSSLGKSVVWHGGEFLVSFGFTTLLFALIYKVLPDVRMAWQDVGIGAAMTALLFTVGKFLIGLYLGHSGVTSAWRGGLAHRGLALGLLFGGDFLFRGRVHPGVCHNLWGGSHAGYPRDGGPERQTGIGTGGAARHRDDYSVVGRRRRAGPTGSMGLGHCVLYCYYRAGRLLRSDGRRKIQLTQRRTELEGGC